MRIVTKIISYVVVTVLCVILAGFLLFKVAQTVFPLRYEEHIEQYSEEYGLDKYEVMSIIYVESKFAPLAKKGNEQGLMMIPSDTVRGVSKEMGLEYTPNMAFDVETNIKMGCFYLAYLKELYPVEDTFLMAYNIGPGTVQSWLEDEANTMDGEKLYYIPDAETKSYVKKVHNFAKVYEFLY